MNVYFSLSRFLPISIYAYHYFHQSGAFATGKSDFQFPFTYWLIFGKFSFKFFPKNSVTKTKTEYQKSAESWNQTKNCKTSFQKSAKIQKCSYKQRKPSTKCQKWNRFLTSAMSSSVFKVKCFLQGGPGLGGGRGACITYKLAPRGRFTK